LWTIAKLAWIDQSPAVSRSTQVVHHPSTAMGFWDARRRRRIQWSVTDLAERRERADTPQLPQLVLAKSNASLAGGPVELGRGQGALLAESPRG
jgi:hypothetical protein